MRIAVLAQDLIWQERLVRSVALAGAEPARAGTAAEFDQILVGSSFAIVDLTAPGYDPFGAIERAVSAGAHVLAVGQHDDVEQRKRALAHGADRVLAYRKLFEDGPATIAAWIGRASVATP